MSLCERYYFKNTRISVSSNINNIFNQNDTIWQYKSGVCVFIFNVQRTFHLIKLSWLIDSKQFGWKRTFIGVKTEMYIWNNLWSEYSQFLVYYRF